MAPEAPAAGTRVLTSNGEDLGALERFVLDPNTNAVTHIVVRSGGRFSEDRLVPFGNVHTEAKGRLVLDEDLGDLDRLPPFHEEEFVRLNERIDGYPAYYWYPPYGHAGYPAYDLGPFGFPLELTDENTPSGTITLQEGIAVISSEGEQVGLVKRLLVDEGTHRLTHFLISLDLSYQEYKLVPVKWVREVDEDLVRLEVSSKILADLPAYVSES